MRPIKFRAWDKKDAQMRDVLAVNFYHGLLSVEYEGDQFVQDGMNRFILMQYSGLKDKNGVEIYEGDIINAHWFYPKLDPETLGMSEGEINLSRLEVMEMRGMLGFYFEDEFMPLGFVPAHEESFEVIGNIYENPELLEVD